jgi:hypothetical protein
MQGLNAIKAWRLETRKKYQHTVKPVAVTARDDKTVVGTTLTGGSLGRPITLDFAFTLSGGKIAALEMQS